MIKEVITLNKVCKNCKYLSKLHHTYVCLLNIEFNNSRTIFKEISFLEKESCEKFSPKLVFKIYKNKQKENLDEGI